jgi:hypothetical protein
MKIMFASRARDVHTFCPVIDQVGAVVRLRVTLTVEILAGDDPRQEPSLLLRRPVGHDRRADEDLAQPPVDAGNAGGMAFLVEDGRLHRGEAPPAVFLRPLGADQLLLQQPPLPRGEQRILPGLDALLPALGAAHARRAPVGEFPQSVGRGLGDPLAHLGPEPGRVGTEIQLHGHRGWGSR